MSPELPSFDPQSPIEATPASASSPSIIPQTARDHSSFDGELLHHTSPLSNAASPAGLSLSGNLFGDSSTPTARGTSRVHAAALPSYGFAHLPASPDKVFGPHPEAALIGSNIAQTSNVDHAIADFLNQADLNLRSFGANDNGHLGSGASSSAGIAPER